MTWKSILKPEGSTVAGLATVGSVFAVYQLNVGQVAMAHATEANHPAMESSRKKAGYMSFVLVAGLTLITKDANLGILGFGTIVAMELAYRHGIMVDPQSNTLQSPAGVAAYAPAENVIPFYAQAETG